MWSSSCTCCGSLLVFSAPFTSQHFLSLRSSTQGDIFGFKTLGPRISTSIFQEDLKKKRGFSSISLQSCPGHLKATDWSILRAQGSNTFWLEYGKFEKLNLAPFFSLFLLFPSYARHVLLYLRPSYILIFFFFLELMYCFNAFQSAPLHLNHPCVCSQAGGQK